VEVTIDSIWGEVCFLYELEILDIFFKGMDKKGRGVYAFFYRSCNVKYKTGNPQQWQGALSNMSHIVRQSIDMMRPKIKTYFGVHPQFHNVEGITAYHNYEAKKRKKEIWEMKQK
jgi:hypothetical protein